MEKTLSDVAVYCSYNEAVDVVNLVPHPKNPNKHSDKQIALLAKVIKSQGWRSPITVSKLSGFIVAGHGRLEAAKVLNVEKVPVDYQDFKTEAEESAHLLADNRIAELSDLDLKGVSEIFTELEAMNFDVELTGFNEIDFTKLDQTEEPNETVEKKIQCPKCGHEWAK